MTDALPTPADDSAQTADIRVIAIGEALIDIAPAADGSGDAEYPGGSPANVALALGRLGRRPTLVAQFGEDDRGAVLREWLESSDVRVAATAPATGRTSTARVSWDEERNASYDFDLAWDVDDAALAAAGDAEAIHIGSIATVLDPGAEAVERFVAARRDGVLVSFDPNARPTITPDHDAVVPRVERLIALSDVMKVSDEDLGWYYPGVPSVEAARRLLGDAAHDGPIVIAVTMGGDGVLLLRGEEELRVPAPKVTVADTIAAGDTFTAAFIDALLSAGAHGAGARERLLALTADELREAAAWAAAAAAITVSRAGANPPTRDELAAAL